MTTYGVTSKGFNRKRTPDILASIEADLKATFGNDIDLSASSVFGQLAGIFAAAGAEFWDQAEDVFNAFDRDKAEGVTLDILYSLIGLTRQAATPTYNENVKFTGTAGTTIAAGKQVKSSLNDIYTVLEDVTIAASGEATGTIVCTTTGPTYLPIKTLTIVTPVPGWTSAETTSSATIGTDRETDAEYRIRAYRSTALQGSGMLDAIYAAVGNVTGVTAVDVQENTSNIIDTYGIPAHGIWVIAEGGDSADIAEAIYQNRAGGIAMKGSVTVDVESELSGKVTQIKFDRPTLVDIYINVSIKIIDSSEFPGDGVDQIKSNLVQYGIDNVGISDDLYYSRLFCPIQEVGGIEISLLGIGTTPPGGGHSTIAGVVGTRYTIDSSNITVNII